MAQVILKDISKIYAGVAKPAVENCSLEIRDEEFVVLVGPSGCGKSTTLRMIAGLEEVSGGDIFIGGQRVNDMAPKDRDIAMVFQNYALYPHMTVYSNMAFGLKLRRFPKAEIDRRVREAAEILGITEYLDRKPKALSGGQRQRVAVGRAIVRKPQVFLFDEPLSNLDAKMRVQMRTEISKLHHQLKATMIYVTHDQVEAMTMGDRIVVMNHGVIQQCDEPIKIYEEPANRFVAGFIGSPPMNFFEGQLQSEGGALRFAHASLQFALPEQYKAMLANHIGKPITMGVRPEHFVDPAAAQSRPSMVPVQATVEVVEQMGSELYLYVRCGEAQIVARIEPHSHARAGEPKQLMLNTEKLHFFDAASGIRIKHS